MTEQQAQRAANVLMTAAAVGAAIYVLRTPDLRRMAFRLASAALTGTIPAWLNGEVRRAWSASADRRPAL